MEDPKTENKPVMFGECTGAQRNQPCPCGSGQKWKRCCPFGKEPVLPSKHTGDQMSNMTLLAAFMVLGGRQ